MVNKHYKALIKHLKDTDINCEIDFSFFFKKFSLLNAELKIDLLNYIDRKLPNKLIALFEGDLVLTDQIQNSLEQLQFLIDYRVGEIQSFLDIHKQSCDMRTYKEVLYIKSLIQNRYILFLSKIVSNIDSDDFNWDVMDLIIFQVHYDSLKYSYIESFAKNRLIFDDSIGMSERLKYLTALGHNYLYRESYLEEFVKDCHTYLIEYADIMEYLGNCFNQIDTLMRKSYYTNGTYTNHNLSYGVNYSYK